MTSCKRGLRPHSSRAPSCSERLLPALLPGASRSRGKNRAFAANGRNVRIADQHGLRTPPILLHSGFIAAQLINDASKVTVVSVLSAPRMNAIWPFWMRPPENSIRRWSMPSAGGFT